MKIKFQLLLGLLLATGVLAAQQEPQFTQFMYYKLGYNPGYAGATETPTVHAIVRQQWLGLDGAPSSQIATFNLPISTAGTGIGVRANRYTAGLEQQYNLEGSYAYRFALGRGHRLGIGLSASARYLNVNFQDATPIQGGGVDQAIPGANSSKVLPNFGFGVYVDGPGYYVGIGLPRLLENNIDLGDEETIIGKEVRHFYFMSGVRFPVSEKLALQPQFLAKYVSGAPFDADVNVTAFLGNAVFTGLSYRLGGNGAGESASALVGFDINEYLTMGLTYDMGLSDLNSAQSGSIEAMIRYSIGGRSDAGEIVDPRNL